MVLTTDELNLKLKKHHNDRFHISNEIIKDVANIEQPLIENFNCSGRPNGLYYSFGNSWLNFLLTKKVNSIFKPCCYLYKVEIVESKVLCLKSTNEVIDFHNKADKYYLNNKKYNLCGEWSINPTKVIPYNESNKYKNIYDFYKSKKIIFTDVNEFINEMKNYYIDFSVQNTKPLLRWDKIAKSYSGIEFLNFHKNKNTPSWYNSLDIESGCIWDVKAFANITLLANVVEYDDIEKSNIWVLNDKGKEYFFYS